MAAALKLRPILANVGAILSIELLTACEAIDLLAPLTTGRLAERARRLVRGVAPPLTQDRPLHADIARLAELVAKGRFAEVLGK